MPLVLLITKCWLNLNLRLRVELGYPEAFALFWFQYCTYGTVQPKVAGRYCLYKLLAVLRRI